MKRIIQGVLLIMIIGLLFSCSLTEDNISNKTSSSEVSSPTPIEKNNFYSYNGKLKVQGTGLVNQYNEPFKLTGIVLANNTNAEFKYDLLKNLKEKWNVNIVKVGFKVEGTEEQYQKMINIIEDAIALDLYVDIIMWNGLLDDKDVLECCVTKFSELSLRYKNYGNILYELANEPSYSWSEIKTFANTVIPFITANAKDPIILCPTQGHNSIRQPIGDRLSYDNTLYVAHNYIGSSVDTRAISEAYYAGIPVFISEWSNQNDYMETRNKDTQMFIELMDKYNYSSTFFLMGVANREGSLCCIKKGMYDNTLNDETLTDTGMFFKDYMTKNFKPVEYNEDDYSTVIACNTDYKNFFWSDEYRNKISKIYTTNNFNIPKDVYKAWDLTKTSSGKVVAYMIPDKEQTDLYELYIAVDGDCFYTEKTFRKFCNFENLTYIDLTYARTRNTIIESMFNNSKKLKTIVGLDKFVINDLENMTKAFCNLQSLESIDLSFVDFSKVTEYDNIFYNLNTNCKVYVKDLEQAKLLSKINAKIAIYYGNNLRYDN